MEFAAKRVICAALALLMMLSFVACAQDVPEQTAPVTEILTEPATVQMTEAPTEPPVDPFEVDDDLVDSTNDIVIDFYEFLEQKNEEHKAVLDTTYSDEWLEQYIPDFHDTLDLVSKEEAEELLDTPQRMLDEPTTKEAALKDVNLLFRIFKCFYGPYYYYGGDETFGAAEEKIVQQIKEGSYFLSLGELAGIISRNLDFVLDRHLMIGEQYICDYNNIAVYDFCVNDMYFYQDDVGYYTKINDRKWYLKQIGTDTNILNYLQITADEKGQLCYCILLCEPKNGSHLNIHAITLARGDREETMPIEWTMFTQRDFRPISERITVENNIPLLDVGFYVPGIGRDAEKSDEQAARLRNMGNAFLSQDVFICDFVSGCGWQALFDSISHSYVDLSAYRFSNLAMDLGRWNMMWHLGDFGEYGIHMFEGRWGINDSLAFVVQDKNNFSAPEGSIADARAIENILTIGGSTGGTTGPGGATCQRMILYNTGLCTDFGATLAITAGYTGDGFCIEPDIWCEPANAADAAYRICEFYEIENTEDTSALSQYNYVETESAEAFEELQYYFVNPPETGNGQEDISFNGEVQISLSDDPNISTTVFLYDLDGNGIDECYIFGINFVGNSDAFPAEIDTIYTTLGKGNFVSQTVYPCVWRLELDGRLDVSNRTVAGELASLLTDIEVKTNLLEGHCAAPKAEKISHTWPGCTRFIFEVIVINGCTWQYEITAKLGDQTLTATHATNILPG